MYCFAVIIPSYKSKTAKLVSKIMYMLDLIYTIIYKKLQEVT